MNCCSGREDFETLLKFVLREITVDESANVHSAFANLWMMMNNKIPYVQASNNAMKTDPSMEFRARSYQKEMFERSMKGNVIVAVLPLTLIPI
jgi:hypothetical protein